MIFVITKEKKKLRLEGMIIGKNDIYRIYRIENRKLLKLFNNFRLVNSIEGVFKIVRKFNNWSGV